MKLTAATASPQLVAISTIIMSVFAPSIHCITAGEIPVELITGVTGHPSYMTHSYSLPLVVRKRDVFVAYLEDDSRTSSSVIRRDHRTGKWSHPQRLGGGRRYDGHYYPNMVADPRGVLHVFYGCHGDRLRYRRSKAASDVSRWENESYPLPSATYPRPFVLANGEIIVFTRSQQNGGIRYGYIVSRDAGKSWSKFNTVIYSASRRWSPYVGGVCIVEGQKRPTVHVSWSWYDKQKKSRPFSYDDPVHASFELGAKQWRRDDGTMVPLPVTHAQITPFLRRERAYVEDATVDSLGRLVVLISQYAITPEPAKKSRTEIAIFDQGAWQFSEPLPGVVLPVGGCRITAAHGWTALVGLTGKHGLVIAQRRDRDREFMIRPIQRIPGLTPVHPIIVADSQEARFHVIATGYQSGQPGCLLYAEANIVP